MKKFKVEIITYGIIIALLAEIISLPIIGPDLLFAAGLAIGTIVALVGFAILAHTGEMLLDGRQKSPFVLGYVIRIVLYALSFLFCIRLSNHCGFGCGTGFVTVPFGILVLYGFVYRVIRKKKNPLNDWTEPKQWNDLSVYDEEDDWK